MRASARCRMDRGERNEVRRGGCRAQRRKCDYILENNDEQQCGKRGSGKGRTPQGMPKTRFRALFDGSGRGWQARGDRGQLSLGFVNENSTGTKINRALR